MWLKLPPTRDEGWLRFKHRYNFTHSGLWENWHISDSLSYFPLKERKRLLLARRHRPLYTKNKKGGEKKQECETLRAGGCSGELRKPVKSLISG